MNPEVSNRNQVSYDLALDMAYLANDAHTELKVQEVNQKYSAHLLNQGLIDLAAHTAIASSLQLAHNTFDHAMASTPSFRDKDINGNTPTTPYVAETTERIVTSEAITNPEVEAHHELREQLLETFEEGYQLYLFAMFDKSKGKRGKNKGEMLQKSEAREVLESKLTPEYLADMSAQIERDKAQLPPELADTVRYRVLFRPNESFTAREETNLIDKVQKTKPLTEFNGDPFLNENYHNETTSHKGSNSHQLAEAVFAPDHTNIPSLPVKEQVSYQAAQNQQQTVAQLRSMSNVEFAMNVRGLAVAGELDDPKTRFAKTITLDIDSYKEDENGRPLDDFVASASVYGDARVSRDFSYVGFSIASRALMV
jgi:hypothetical protein